MRRTPRKKWTRKKVVCFRVLLCIAIAIGILSILRGTLFWGTVAAHIINFCRSLKPVIIITSAIALVFSIFTVFATIWSFFFGSPETFSEKAVARKRFQKALIVVTLVCVCYVPFYALDQFGFAQWLIRQEQDALSAVGNFLEDTTPAGAGAESPAAEPAPAAPSLPQFGMSADLYPRLSAEQYGQLFYTAAVDWDALDNALEDNAFERSSFSSFYTVETKLLHGAFPQIVTAVQQALHTRLAQRTKLYTPALSVRVQAPGGAGECSLLEAMDACDVWDTEYGDSAGLEECLAQHRYIQQLYRDHPCERLARLYADICYRISERLSELTGQVVDAGVLLYYFAEEIAAYEALYRHTRSWLVFKELAGVYARIAASGLVAYNDRLRALVLAHADLPPDCI